MGCPESHGLTMARLAPRPSFATNESTGQTRDSGLGKEGKARQRDRNAASPHKGLTTSGSSGSAKYVAQMPKVPFEDVEDVLVHLCDISGKMSHTQVGSSGWQTSTLNVPLAYAHEVLEAHLAAQQGMLFLRVYYVPIEAFLPPELEDDDGEQ
jgi:hypothetical protein